MARTRAAGTLTDVRRNHGARLVDCGAPGDAHGVPGYDGCQYFVGFSRPPQGVVDLSHAVVLGNEERTHPLYPFIAPAPRFNVIDGPRAMRPVPTPPGFGERSGPHKLFELVAREPRTLTHVVLKQH